VVALPRFASVELLMLVGGFQNPAANLSSLRQHLFPELEPESHSAAFISRRPNGNPALPNKAQVIKSFIPPSATSSTLSA